jgi:hypothetical protein
MNQLSFPAEHRIALYDRRRDRHNAYREWAYELLGGKCHACGSTSSVRHRFIDPSHLLATRYRTNPATLLRRICREPDLRMALYLICRECRVAHRSIAPQTTNPATPGPKPLHSACLEER